MCERCPPGDTTQDIRDPRRVGRGEPRRVACPYIEAVKAVKQIRVALRPGAADDGVEAAGLGHYSAQGAIWREGRRDLGLTDGAQGEV
jgi:hypothetical protein